MTTLTRHPSRVEIDATDHTHVFPCLVATDVRWNGWAVPYFTREQVLRVAAMIRSDEPSNLHLDGDAAVLTQDYGDGPEEERIDPDEDGLYCVGGFSWTWQELPEGAPTGDDELDAWLDARAGTASVYCVAANEWNARRVAEGRPFDGNAMREQTAYANAAVAAATR